jgi:hypothetical protein
MNPYMTITIPFPLNTLVISGLGSADRMTVSWRMKDIKWIHLAGDGEVNIWASMPVLAPFLERLEQTI